VKPPTQPISIVENPGAADDAETLPQRLPADERTTRLWLIRHAEVEERYHHTFGGRIDMELSAHGHEQARALGRFLGSKRMDAFYASPMKRVQQTLASLVTSGAPEPVIVPELREVDFGDWTGLHWSEVKARYGVSASTWLDQLECDGIRNAECFRTVRGRVEPVLRQVLRGHIGQEVAIVCHGGIIRVLLAILLDWPFPRLRALEIDYASLTKVLWTPTIGRLQLANFTPWRDLAE
jgi:broad specificity phosphatase PhoE